MVPVPYEDSFPPTLAEYRGSFSLVQSLNDTALLVEGPHELLDSYLTVLEGAFLHHLMMSYLTLPDGLLESWACSGMTGARSIDQGCFCYVAMGRLVFETGLYALVTGIRSGPDSSSPLLKQPEDSSPRQVSAAMIALAGDPVLPQSSHSVSSPSSSPGQLSSPLLACG